jgi:hypothetical protein
LGILGIKTSGSLRWTSSSNSASDKPFYHHPGTIQPFGFVLLFFDGDGFADLIDGALLITHELSVLFNLGT